MPTPTAEPVRQRLDRLAASTGHLEPPFAVVDDQALLANADRLVARAGGLPIRLATKSVRVRSILTDVVARPGFAGLLGFSLPEALWLVGTGATDVVVAYPTVDRGALRGLGTDPRALREIALMVDDPAQLDVIEACVPRDAGVRVMLDVDASWRIGPLHVGARRSPVRTPADAARLAADVRRRPWARLAGVMLYDAQIAGTPDSVLMRRVKAGSLRELAVRRAQVVAAVREHAADDEPFVVNAGGTGSLHTFSTGTEVTEVAAGSGLFAPTLFDGYDGLGVTPAAWFVTSVVRRPAPRWATVFSGGYIASGPSSSTRLPRPVRPAGLRLSPLEGAGEVQTPLRGRAADALAVGDRVWFRHAKAGELCERFAAVHLVRADGTVDVRPTYRGEGRCFG